MDGGCAVHSVTARTQTTPLCGDTWSRGLQVCGWHRVQKPWEKLIALKDIRQARISFKKLFFKRFVCSFYLCVCALV